MENLIVNQAKVNAANAKEIIKLCPFGAISYNKGELDISSACKMCKMCVKKSDGIIEFVEDIKQTINKELWKGICVYVEHSVDKIHRVTYELCGKAKELSKETGHPVYALYIGHKPGKEIENLLHYGVDKIFVYENMAFSNFRIEPFTAAFCDFIEKVKPSSVLVGATNLGRQLAPRVAARCRAGLTADCTVLAMKKNSDLVQIRPAFGGNIMAQIISPDTRPQFCTVRYKVFKEPIPSNEMTGEIIKMELSEDKLSSLVSVLSVETKPTDVDISEAEVIVVIGRGAMSENMQKYAKELSDLLGGVVACSRPLVEGNLFDAKRQIGLSGRTVNAKFIICLGISGAVQFAAGMKSSECIVAINSDKNAPIFDVAHYGVVGDVNEIVPHLIAKIKEAQTDVQ